MMPETFWDEPAMAAALASQHMGNVIKAWRTHPHHGPHPISQGQLAEWAGITQPQLSRIETRQPIKNLDYLIHWARTLGIPRERLWFSMPGQLPPPAISGSTTSAELVRSDRQRHGLWCSSTHSVVIGQSTPAEAGVEALTEGMVALAAEDSARFVQRVEGSNVGCLTLEQFHDDISRIVQVYPTTPLAPVFREVLSLRDRVFELIGGHQHPHQTTELYLIGGLLCAVLSNASFDLGAFRAAKTQARTAFVCADLAGCNWLRAWLRGMEALIAYWSDQPSQAVALASSGWQYTPEQGTARVRLAAIEARAHARLGDRQQVDGALRRADDARDQVIEPDITGMFQFPAAKQSFYAANCHLALNRRASDARIAEQLATQAVAWYEQALPPQRRVGEQSLARLEFAFARVEQHHIPDSTDVVRDVIDATTTRPTNCVIRHLARFTTRLDTLAPAERAAGALADEVRGAIDLTAPIDAAFAELNR